MDYVRSHILVCTCKDCMGNDSLQVIEALENELRVNELDKEVLIVKTAGLGMCENGLVVVVYPEGAAYVGLTPEDAGEIITEHLLKGKLVKRLLFGGAEGKNSLSDTGFYKKQLRIALRNCGVINPEDIDEYIGYDGYMALGKVLTGMEPQRVIDEIKKAGLRGRGGAGFSTGMKWQLAADSPGEVKYVCCNADEGDPGAFMDRSILEGDPHSIVEAMTIAGYAIGAGQGYIYVRAEYPIAVERLEIAISKAREYGLLGHDIFGSGFDFDLEVRLGSGAFVCGEETALMVSIEGKRGEPRSRPPFPSVRGLFDKPTLLNNAETFANITWIINKGAEAYAQIGTEGSKGTKVFALGGNIVNTGLVEVPMGMSLREIVEDIGGGVPGDKKFKAVQLGGPSGACIPAGLAETEIDYDNLSSIGAMMGSGGLIVLDEDNCMVDIAKFFLDFTVDESCGKCSPCRIGTKRMHEILEKITEGKGSLEDLEDLEELAYHIKSSSLCGLGQTAPNPVLSTLRFFKDEYLAHVVEKRCPSGICKDLLNYYIVPEACKGCGACEKVCPSDAIAGKLRSPYIIDEEKCIKCGSCYEVCKFDAITKN